MSADEELEQIRHGITAVRREGYKAAAIPAFLDGVLVSLLTVLVASLLPFELSRGAYLAFALGGLVACIEFVYRIRQPLVDRFEAVNPDLNEALRTARDALNDEEESVMARALYTDVYRRLQSTSSRGLLNLPRLAGRVIMLFVVSFAVVQAPIIGVGVDPSSFRGPGDSTGQGSPATATTTPIGLQSGEEVLGDAETVTPGSENLSAVIDRQTKPSGDEQAREYETGGLADDSYIDPAPQSYAPPEDIEHAELIKAYNLRIREQSNDGG